MDVRTLMRQAVTFNRDRVAIVTEDRQLTFSEAWTRGLRLANALRDMGVKPGDRVDGLEDNVVGAADFLIGCAAAGAVRVPLYPRDSAGGARSALARSGSWRRSPARCGGSSCPERSV